MANKSLKRTRARVVITRKVLWFIKWKPRRLAQPLYNILNKYNDKGFLTESIAKYFDGDTLIFQEIYTYDGVGNEIEVYQSNSEGESGKETHTYDDRYNPIEVNRYYPIDSLEASWRYTYKYDRNNFV